jgi:hypothetical protein
MIGINQSAGLLQESSMYSYRTQCYPHCVAVFVMSANCRTAAGSDQMRFALPPDGSA